jgi:hypothetical protein
MRTTISAILVGWMLAGVAQAGNAPETLRCEHLENPLCIDVAKLRLSWMMAEMAGAGNQEPERGLRQTAYQVLVASSEKILAAERGDLWDSGKVNSEKSACIEYAGQTLSPATRYWWEMRISGAGLQDLSAAPVTDHWPTPHS